MALDTKLESDTTLGLINQWQEEASVDPISVEQGIIARLLQGCLDLFSLLLRQLPTTLLSKKAGKVLRRSRATLMLWSDGHGVPTGRLDRVLESSKSLQYTTLATLNSLCSILLHRFSRLVLPGSTESRALLLRDTNAHVLYEQTKWILAGLDETSSHCSSESDTSSDEGSNTYSESIVEDIKTHVQCLVDLNSALECPAIDPGAEDEPSIPRLEKHSAYDYYAELIVAKFPKARLDLVECLGKANWDRYQRMQLERSNNEYDPAAGVKYLENKSTASLSQLADSKFRDSGLGTSIPAQSSTYAATVISFFSSIPGAQHIRIPPLSLEARRGWKFSCIACGKYVRATTNREWRKHLFKDMQPYTCFYAGCNFTATPFPDRQAWSHHLELDHGLGPYWAEQECPLCFESTSVGKGAILSHFARHMEDIALATLPRGIDSEANSEAGSDGESVAESAATGSSILNHTRGGLASEALIDLFMGQEDLPSSVQRHRGAFEDIISSPDPCLVCGRQILEGTIHCSEACRSASRAKIKRTTEQQDPKTRGSPLAERSFTHSDLAIPKQSTRKPEKPPVESQSETSEAIKKMEEVNNNLSWLSSDLDFVQTEVASEAEFIRTRRNNLEKWPGLAPSNPSEELMSEWKQQRKRDIIYRCSLLNPPIPPNVLRHMVSFKAAIQISQPLTDYAWDMLLPRLQAQLPDAQEMEGVGNKTTSFFSLATDPGLSNNTDGKRVPNETANKTPNQAESLADIHYADLDPLYEWPGKVLHEYMKHEETTNNDDEEQQGVRSTKLETVTGYAAMSHPLPNMANPSEPIELFNHYPSVLLEGAQIPNIEAFRPRLSKIRPTIYPRPVADDINSSPEAPSSSVRIPAVSRTVNKDREQCQICENWFPDRQRLIVHSAEFRSGCEEHRMCFRLGEEHHHGTTYRHQRCFVRWCGSIYRKEDGWKGRTVEKHIRERHMG